jgi:ABC-type multidrug transport system fused ATPase/permease subunit
MTTTQTPPAEQVPEGQEWRGVAADGRDDLSAETTARLADRSRRLLKNLLTPYRSEVKLLGVAVVIENAARLSIPLLVALGIDKGIPPKQDNNLKPLFVIVGCVLAATLIQAVARNVFLVRSGQIGQDILFEIRQRIFRHFQRLSPAFHDSYTSGRVISRQTSDVDAIYEMLETGFDGLITAALTLVGTAVLLLYLDVKLGLVALLCGPFLAWVTNWFRRSRRTPTRSPARRSRWSSSTSSSRWVASAPCRRSAASRATRRSSTTSTTSTARPTWWRSGWWRGSCRRSG